MEKIPNFTRFYENKKYIYFIFLTTVLILAVAFIFISEYSKDSEVYLTDETVKNNFPIYNKTVLDEYLDQYYPNITMTTGENVPISDWKLVRNSDLIVRGKVKETSPTYETNGIFYNVAVEIEEVYKGTMEEGETVIFQKSGGCFETRASIDLDSFNYQSAVGDEFVLYLTEGKNDGAEKLYVPAYPVRGELFVYENRLWNVEGKEYELVY